MKFTSDYTRVAAQFMAPALAMEELGLEAGTGSLSGDRKLLADLGQKFHTGKDLKGGTSQKALAVTALWETYIKQKKTIPSIADAAQEYEGHGPFMGQYYGDEESTADIVKRRSRESPRMWLDIYLSNVENNIKTAQERDMRLVRQWIHTDPVWAMSRGKSGNIADAIGQVKTAHRWMKESGFFDSGQGDQYVSQAHELMNSLPEVVLAMEGVNKNWRKFDVDSAMEAIQRCDDMLKGILTKYADFFAEFPGRDWDEYTDEAYQRL